PASAMYRMGNRPVMAEAYTDSPAGGEAKGPLARGQDSTYLPLMSPRIARLDSRAQIRVAGPDARPFLHNLLTQDVETLADGELRFGALLSPPGRLLFDLFLLGEADGVLLDVA